VSLFKQVFIGIGCCHDVSLHTQDILWLLCKYLCLHIMLFVQPVEEVQEHLAVWNIFLLNCLQFPEHYLSRPVPQMFLQDRVSVGSRKCTEWDGYGPE
jgi:hypothetical protein